MSGIDIDGLSRELASTVARYLDAARPEAPNELTPTEVAERLRRSRAWVYQQMAEGELPFVQLTPKRRIIRAADLEAFLLARRSA